MVITFERTSPRVRNFQLIGTAVVVAGTIILLLAPSVSWVLHDQTAWWWDQANYAYGTLQLVQARRLGLDAWITAMAHALPSTPPLIAWAGQLFVPLRHITGEVEPSLLFLNLFWGGLALWLVYVTTRRMGAQPIESAAAMLVCGGSGIFIAMTHQYLVEMTQCATVAIMIFVAWRAERRSLMRTLSLAGIATGFAMLSKASSLTFVLPMLCYVTVALLVARSGRRPKTDLVDFALLVAASIVIVSAGIWYHTNWNHVAQHFRDATAGDVAMHYGRPVELGLKLQYWLYWLGEAISPFLALSVAAGAITVSALSVAAFRAFRDWHFLRSIEIAVENGTLFAFTLAGTVCATILGFSLQVNEDTRFLIPIIPMVAVLLGWAISVLRLQFVTGIAFLLLALNAAINHAYSFGLNPLAQGSFPYLWPVNLSPADKQLLTKAVQESCHDGNNGRTNIIAVSYKSLNGNSANFYAAKNALVGSRPCAYQGLGYSSSDLKQALDTIITAAPAYVITVAPDKQPPVDFVNKVSRPVAEHLARDPHFELAFGSDDFLLIYRDIR
jgi:hypothetical protein